MSVTTRVMVGIVQTWAFAILAGGGAIALANKHPGGWGLLAGAGGILMQFVLLIVSAT